jgi:hypothetical protein
VLCIAKANGYHTPGLKMNPKAFVIMYYVELGKPYMLLQQEVSNRKETKWHRGQTKRIKSECRICNGIE